MIALQAPRGADQTQCRQISRLETGGPEEGKMALEFRFPQSRHDPSQ